MIARFERVWHQDRGKAVAILPGLGFAAVAVIWVAIAILQGLSNPLTKATRTVSVTVSATSANEPTDDISNTHGAIVCVGQARTNPSNCAKTNQQGVAHVPVGSVRPGSYETLVIKPGQSSAYWAQQSAGLGSQVYPETITADGTPPPVDRARGVPVRRKGGAPRPPAAQPR